MAGYWLFGTVQFPQVQSFRGMPAYPNHGTKSVLRAVWKNVSRACRPILIKSRICAQDSLYKRFRGMPAHPN